MIRVAQMILVWAIASMTALGQPETRHQDTAPPPLKVISRADRAQIDEAKNAKARVKVTLELADTHLASSESETAQQNFDGAAAAAGRYWALVHDVFEFLKTMNRDNDKTRDLYKRVELSLRAHGPRLSAIRRGTPVEYAVWMKEIEDLARKGRTEALNSFYGHTVVQDRQQESSQKQRDKPNP
jgi:hypothetical protein